MMDSTIGGRIAGPRTALLGCALLALAACSSAAHSPQRRLDGAFARIQVHEAAIERARLGAERGDTGCEQTCASASSARREQAALCGIARDIADADALIRCERAQQTVRAVDARAARRCACK